jgi:hypothetical protein
MTDRQYRIRVRKGETEFEVEGDKEFVEKHFKDFSAKIREPPAKLPSIEGVTPAPTPEKEVPLDNLSLAEFYKWKNPKNFNEVVVVFAYWLTKRKGKEEFVTADVSGCFDESRVSKPANVTQHIANMSSGKKAYLTEGSTKRMWKLTLTGEEFVEQELPRKSEG